MMMQSFNLIVPELFLLVMACVILLVDLACPKKHHYLRLLSQVATLATACCLGYQWGMAKTLAFHNQWIVDSFSIGLKGVLCVLMFAVFTYGGAYVIPRGLSKGEYYVLALFSLLGMMVLVSSMSLLTLYLGLELLSLPLYVLVASAVEAGAIEAGMKYFILGGLASGLMLYGISLIFGATGAVGFVELQQAFQSGAVFSTTWMQLGLVFLLVGLFFKLGAAPFHMWVPDVYAGAPSSVALLIATAPKVAAFGMAYRLLTEGFAQYAALWQQLLIVVALLSLGLGNIIAIVQTNLKRLLGYSAISHVGFIALGLLVGPMVGYKPALFYVILYSMMTAAAFGVILMVSRAGYDLEEIEDLRGLSERSPLLAFSFLLVLFSMAGIPPLVGFYAKFVILQALIETGWMWLAVAALGFSILGAFYYLRVIRCMYFDTPITFETPQGGSIGMKVLLVTNAFAMLVLGLFPDLILPFCQLMLSN